jgi:hypothetical protein
MSPTISPDQAAGDPNPLADTVPSSSPAKNKKRRQEDTALWAPLENSRAKTRQQEEADTHDGNGGTRPAAKVVRFASSEEKTKEQEADETPEAQLTTERIMNLLQDLWSDDTGVIQRTLKEIADIGLKCKKYREKNEVKMRVLGVHAAVFQLLQKHIGCLEIQQQGMNALGNLCMLMHTAKLLGEIGCVEVILARMEKYPDSETVQHFGCSVIGRLLFSMNGNVERVEKSGGIAVVISAMTAHPNCEQVQYHGCIALAYMSEWEEYRPLIVEAGGVSAIAFVIEKYRDDPKMRKKAYIAMEKLIKQPWK